jgi:hypothetical protein
MTFSKLQDLSFLGPSLLATVTSFLSAQKTISSFISLYIAI